jgi:hypothetical protein
MQKEKRRILELVLDQAPISGLEDMLATLYQYALYHSIEIGDVTLVRRCLGKFSDPEARKKAILTPTVFTDHALNAWNFINDYNCLDYSGFSSPQIVELLEDCFSSRNELKQKLFAKRPSGCIGIERIDYGEGNILMRPSNYENTPTLLRLLPYTPDKMVVSYLRRSSGGMSIFSPRLGDIILRDPEACNYLEKRFDVSSRTLTALISPEYFNAWVYSTITGLAVIGLSFLPFLSPILAVSSRILGGVITGVSTTKLTYFFLATKLEKKLSNTPPVETPIEEGNTLQEMSI